MIDPRLHKLLQKRKHCNSMEVRIPRMFQWYSPLASFSIKPTVQRSRSPRIVPRAPPPPPPPPSLMQIWPCAHNLVPSKNASIISGYAFKQLSRIGLIKLRKVAIMFYGSCSPEGLVVPRQLRSQDERTFLD